MVIYFDVFLKFQSHVERLLNHKIVHVQSNRSHKIGISHRVSCPHTHQQNGSAERKHHHIVETGLTLLAHASVPFRFWSDAFITACFLINHMPTRIIHMQTPLQRLLGETPDYTFFKVFGCACWPNLRPYNNHKLAFRSKKCVFLGYSPLHKGYKCLHVPSNRVYISRDVVFNELVFSFSNLPPTASPSISSNFPFSLDQFEDYAYAPSLLPNHGAGIGRGAHLELLDQNSSPASSHVDSAGSMRYDDRMQLHAPASLLREPGPSPVHSAVSSSARHGPASPLPDAARPATPPTPESTGSSATPPGVVPFVLEPSPSPASTDVSRSATSPTRMDASVRCWNLLFHFLLILSGRLLAVFEVFINRNNKLLVL